MSSNGYDQYLLGEWKRFLTEPARWNASLQAVAGRRVERVLDVGCGAGQELLPFGCQGAFGVGVDLAAASGPLGRRLLAEHQPGSRTVFVRAGAESLPFPGGTFDLVICRLALPYTDNRRALAEVARVLRPAGVFILKIHCWRYYADRFLRGIREADWRAMVHAARAIVTGIVFHLTGIQTDHRLLHETFQSRWLLCRLIAPLGLSIEREMPDSNPATPCFVIIKAG